MCALRYLLFQLLSISTRVMKQYNTRICIHILGKRTRAYFAFTLVLTMALVMDLASDLHAAHSFQLYNFFPSIFLSITIYLFRQDLLLLSLFYALHNPE